MVKKILLGVSLCIGFITVLAAFCEPRQAPVPRYDHKINNIETMPIIADHPSIHLAYGGEPLAERDERYVKWLSASVKIKVYGATGSGTIVYYDESEGYAYVQSCGHLWSGFMSAKQGLIRKERCKIVTWYRNSDKLSAPLEYPAEVMYFSNVRGQDCSLLRFKPDWIPDYFPIAPVDFELTSGMRLHSCGSDGGTESGHYDVRYLGMNGPDIVTTENSPRPGRSGGGLMVDDLYVGICWGTTDKRGIGNGLFTPLSVIHKLNYENGFGWLNDMAFTLARKIPIVDRNNPQGAYPPNYIPMPYRH